MQCCSSNNTSNIPQKELCHETSEADHNNFGADRDWHCHRSYPHGSGNTPEKAMNELRIDFIQEILQEAEIAEAERRIEVDRLKADQLLAAVAVIEGQMAEVNELVDKETKLLEDYRSNEFARLDKKRSWLVFNLDGFMRSTGEKTVRLAHGILRLRKGRDRVAIIALDQFLKVGPTLGLVRTVPEELAPDLQAIVNHIKKTGEIPPGTEWIQGDTKFSYSTINGGNNGAEAESGSEDQ
jgi:hypothetical protein